MEMSEKKNVRYIILKKLAEIKYVRYGPQSPSFPQKLATALKNKIHTLHNTTIHVYHKCLGINTVITLNLIVSNRLLFPEYTSS